MSGSFPFGRDRHYDKTRPVTTFKTAWQNLKKRSGIEIRWHDLRHTVGTNLAESGATDETIMALMGHVSRSMLTHYSHIRTEMKRKAMESIQTKRSVLRAVAGRKMQREGDSVGDLRKLCTNLRTIKRI